MTHLRGICPVCKEKVRSPNLGIDLVTYSNGRRELWHSVCRDKAYPQETHHFASAAYGTPVARKRALKWISYHTKRLRKAYSPTAATR